MMTLDYIVPPSAAMVLMDNDKNNRCTPVPNIYHGKDAL